jgi:hypothetical protein
MESTELLHLVAMVLQHSVVLKLVLALRILLFIQAEPSRTNVYGGPIFINALVKSIYSNRVIGSESRDYILCWYCLDCWRVGRHYCYRVGYREAAKT